jgi:DNA uptake protein ComE-like DNA-binding protein
MYTTLAVGVGFLYKHAQKKPVPARVCTQPVQWDFFEQTGVACLDAMPSHPCTEVKAFERISANPEGGCVRSKMHPNVVRALGFKPHINDVDTVFLESLPGVGPSMAHALVHTRSEKGGFHTWEEVDSTPRVGPKTLEHLRSFLDL